MRAFFSTSTMNARRLRADPGVGWQTLPCAVGPEAATRTFGATGKSPGVSLAGHAACSNGPELDEQSSKCPVLSAAADRFLSCAAIGSLLTARHWSPAQSQPAACLQSVPSDATLARPALAAADGEGISARSDCAARYGCIWPRARRSPGRAPTGGDRAAVEGAPSWPAESGRPCACGMWAWRTARSGRQIYFAATASKVRSGG